MASQIVFLGTAGCDLVFSQKRASGGIVVEADKEVIHIDPGPGSFVAAKNTEIDLRKISIILLSHEHLDSCNDANILIDAITNRGNEKRGTLIANNSTIHYIISNLQKEKIKKIINTKPNKQHKINNVLIKTTQTKEHAKGLGFKLYLKDFSFGYTADTKYFDDMPKLYSDVNILVVNSQFDYKSKPKNHLTLTDVERLIKKIKLIKKNKLKLIILNRFSQKLIDKNPTYIVREMKRNLQQFFKEKCKDKKDKVEIIAASDGMIINPKDYSAEADQLKLVGY